MIRTQRRQRICESSADVVEINYNYDVDIRKSKFPYKYINFGIKEHTKSWESPFASFIRSIYIEDHLSTGIT